MFFGSLRISFLLVRMKRIRTETTDQDPDASNQQQQKQQQQQSNADLIRNMKNLLIVGGEATQKTIARHRTANHASPSSVRLKCIHPTDYRQWQVSRQLRTVAANRRQAEQKRIFIRGKFGDKMAFRASRIASRTSEAAAMMELSQVSFFKELIAKATRLMVHSGRRTLFEEDIQDALRFMGIFALTPNNGRMRRKRIGNNARGRPKAHPSPLVTAAREDNVQDESH